MISDGEGRSFSQRRRIVPFASFLAGLLSLWLVGSAFADPVISEFMASNKHGIADEDGDHSDWLEIHNPDATAVDLAGWSLTDDPRKPSKWIFPAVSLPAGSYLVVFASGKDRRIVGRTLHTNFALSADGEYLALVKPDGMTKTTEFAPAFPAQVEDVSYGVSSSLQTVTLARQGSAAEAFVPKDGTLGTSWQRADFVENGGWLSGTIPVGFFNYAATSNPDLSSTLGLDLYAEMAGKPLSAYIRVPFAIPDPAEVQGLHLRVNYDDGFAAFLNGQPAASGNAPTFAALAYNSVSLVNHPPSGFEEFDLAPVLPDLVAGTNILAIQSLNASASSSDAYVLLELTALMDTGIAPITGYFPIPTPGAQNGGPETVELPQTVTFSRPSGTFTTGFSLVLAGAATGQKIRYEIADPSGAPGANIPEPTAASPLYSGPLAIGSSKLIRAAVFDTTTGQKGKTVTVEYLQLETGPTNNTSNFTSNLPIVVGDDYGAGEPVDSGAGTYTSSMLHIFPPVGGVASLNSTPTIFSRAGLRVRGRSSQGFPKKSYGMETWDETNNDLKVPLLGLAKDSDWILNGPWGADDTYLNNAFIYAISRECGEWASGTKFVEMFTNSNGGKLDYTDYAGVYVLTEKIKSGSNRLNIASIGSGDNSGDAVTGGYIFKIDSPEPAEVSWFTNHGIPSSPLGQSLIVVEPDPDTDTTEQIGYLKGYVQAFEDALVADSARGFTTRNYRGYIDVPSWIDHHILNALAFNVDALRLSAYYHKDRDEKIHAGPLWDFDLAMGSDDARSQNPRSWSNIEYYFTLDWWGYLFKDPDFVQAWVDRWWELRGGPLSDVNLNALADAMGAQIGEAAAGRDAGRWPDNGHLDGIYLHDIAALKNWMTSPTADRLGRTHWLDTQIPGPPVASVSSGVVASGTMVALTGTSSIRYTTDGSDPRVSNTLSSSTALVYTSPLAIAHTTVLTARRRGGFFPFPGVPAIIWSAPVKRVYLVNEAFAVASDLAISEINYHPAAPTTAETAAFPGGVSASDFEFLELKNIGNRTVNTFEMKFVEGAPFKELVLAPLSLAPGDTALVIKNRAAFLARYGSALSGRIVGEWDDGALSNDGERVELLARDGSTVEDLTYGDNAGAGRSLNRAGTAWMTDIPSPGTSGPTYGQWKGFYYPNGGPGSGDTDDTDHDGAGNQTEYAHASDPAVAENQAALEPTFMRAGENDYVFSFTKPTNRPSAQYTVQQSTNLQTWTPVADSVVASTFTTETRAVHITGTAGAHIFFRLQTAISPSTGPL